MEGYEESGVVSVFEEKGGGGRHARDTISALLPSFLKQAKAPKPVWSRCQIKSVIGR